MDLSECTQKPGHLNEGFKFEIEGIKKSKQRFSLWRADTCAGDLGGSVVSREEYLLSEHFFPALASVLCFLIDHVMRHPTHGNLCHHL